ncbi:MAG: reactive intermediate/imine deaminase [Candidatus Eisenbacteria bacterium RBG_16_71_46]|nr:MAG: reactive intermediate/imine deaminase [Candidatus Eisenbacteria bacterium RBG_16_71_46]OGF23646.1 MAG: reactive intermediate/imine deaminase [Candidatus Eisenbacteria bacterium RBG_19FT_COMBO_70_11]
MKSPLNVSDAPAAIGPYSQAQVVRLHGGNRLVFTSGQIALDPASGQIVGGDAAAQTTQVLRNLGAVLGGAGLTLADVVKTTVFLADMADFQAMNEVYAKHFPDAPPARTTIAAAGLPRGARVEIEAVAVGRDL